MESPETLTWIALAVAGVAVVVALVLALARRARAVEARALGQTVDSLVRSQTELAGRLAQLNDSQAAVGRTLDQRLEAVSKRLGDSLTHSATQTASTLGELKQRLSAIDQAQKNITELTGQVVSLQDILADKQARGAFGEIQLNDIVQTALPPSAYAFQAQLRNGKRADCLIRLPNPPGPIVIDAKFPLESYRALRAAEDEATRTQAARAFAADVQKHVRDIAERYIVPGETADSALMFLPSEAVYAELHANFGQVVEQSYRLKVWIVSPTTLMATLNTVRAVLKDVRMREQAGLIQTEVLKLLEDVGRLQKRVENLRRHFGQAESDIREIDTSADKIVRRAERIEEVQLEDGDAALPAAAELTGTGSPRAIAGD